MQRSVEKTKANELNINTFYQYVLMNLAHFDASKIPTTQVVQVREKFNNQIKEKFSKVLQGQPQIFRKLLREVNAKDLEETLFGNATDSFELTQQYFPSKNIIEKNFQKLNEKYHYFDQKSLDDFIIFYKGCKLVADFIEQDNTEEDEAAYIHAYKMLVLFNLAQGRNPFAKFQKYIEAHNFAHVPRPVHDVFLLPIPVNNPPLDLSIWQRLIQAHGVQAMALFQEAAIMKEKFKEDPSTIEKAEEYSASIQYRRASEYPLLARLCKSYKIEEYIFNKCLEIEKRRKTRDNLPDVAIDGSDVNHPGYYLVKLPIDDPRAYILGYITKCCQSIGGDSQKCVIDGVTLENNGFYVLLKKRKSSSKAQPFVEPGKINYKEFEIVGQGYTWLSLNGNLTIDSWENLRPEVDDSVIVPMLNKFGEKAQEINPEIVRVTIGVGGNTPEEFDKSIVGSPEIMLTGYQYGDSKKQALVYFNQEKIDNALSALRADLVKKFPMIDVTLDIFAFDQIYSLYPIKLLRRNFIESDRLNDVVIYMHNHSHVFGKNNLGAEIIKKFREPLEVCKAIVNLQQNDLLTDENRKEILNCEDEKYTTFMANGLIGLKNAGILTDATRSAFIAKGGWPYYSNIVILLSKEQILSEGIFNGLSRIRDWDLLNRYVIQFNEARILTKENYKFLVKLVSSKSFYFETRKSLDNLIKNKQLSLESFDELPEVSNYFKLKYEAKEKKQSELRAKLTIEEIKQSILAQDWKGFRMFSDYIKLPNGTNKKVPPNVKLQWDQIILAEENKEYKKALDTIINIGDKATKKGIETFDYHKEFDSRKGSRRGPSR